MSTGEELQFKMNDDCGYKREENPENFCTNSSQITAEKVYYKGGKKSQKIIDTIILFVNLKRL